VRPFLTKDVQNYYILGNKQNCSPIQSCDLLAVSHNIIIGGITTFLSCRM
jgi:hypothetical protein